MDKLLNQYGESPESDGIYQHPSTIWFQFHQKFTISHTCCLLSDCWCSGNLNNNHLHIKSPTHFVASDSLSLQTKPKPAERGTTPAIPNHRSELPVAWSSGTIFPYKLAFIEFYIGRAGQRWNRMWTLEWHCWPVVFFGGVFLFEERYCFCGNLFQNHCKKIHFFHPHPQIKFEQMGLLRLNVF